MTDALLADLRALAEKWDARYGPFPNGFCHSLTIHEATGSIRQLIAKHEARTNGDVGVWVVYDHDHGPYPISVWPDAENAARSAAQQGYGRVAYWPFEKEFADAIREWETQKE